MMRRLNNRIMVSRQIPLFIAIVATTSLPACAKKEAVDVASERDVRAFFERAEYPTPVADLWKASVLKDELICGRMESVNGGDQHRFYYDLQSRHGQIEMAQVSTFDAMGNAMHARNRELFDRMWEDNCAEGDASIF